MKTTEKNPSPPLSDVLYAFALAHKSPSADLLNDFIRRYPQYTAELTGLAVELAVDDTIQDKDAEAVQTPTEPMQSAEVLKMISQFQNRLHEVRRNDENAQAAERVAVAAENPFTSLTRTEIKAFADTLNANGVFFMKLRDCQIHLETMSEGFLQKLADLRKTTVARLRAYLAQDVQLAFSADYKSEKKPETGTKQTFEEAVRSSGLSAEQQEYLLKL